MKKKIIAIFLIAIIHFITSIVLFTVTWGWFETTPHTEQAESLTGRILPKIVEILYSPLVSQGLFQKWIDGNWMFVIVFLNSLLWAIAIYFLVILTRKIFKKS